jgi:hypothetical protein
MEKHSVSRLIGAPPGYVGYEEGGQLTEAVSGLGTWGCLLCCNVLCGIDRAPERAPAWPPAFLTEGFVERVYWGERCIRSHRSHNTTTNNPTTCNRSVAAPTRSSCLTRWRRRTQTCSTCSCRCACWSNRAPPHTHTHTHVRHACHPLPTQTQPRTLNRSWMTDV